MSAARSVEFRYACAVDHSGCNKDVEAPSWKTSELQSKRRIYEYFQENLGTAFKHLASNVIVQPDGQKNWHPHWETYISCELPDLIAKFYKHCKKSSESDES